MNFDFANYLQPQFLIAALAAVIILALFLLWSKKKPKQRALATTTTAETPEELALKEFGPTPVRVCDLKYKRIYDDVLPAATVAAMVKGGNDLGRQWYRDGVRRYGITKDALGQYKPISEPTGLGNSPTSLFDDMQHPTVPILYDMRDEASAFDKYGKILMWVAAIGFLMFMWSQS